MLCTYWQTHLSSCDLYNQVQVLSTALIRHPHIPYSSICLSLCSVAIKIVKLLLERDTRAWLRNFACYAYINKDARCRVRWGKLNKIKRRFKGSKTNRTRSQRTSSEALFVGLSTKNFLRRFSQSVDI